MTELPAELLFGTSSWNYPGWVGLVYPPGEISEKKLSAEGLREYSKNPLFRTVGIDSTFYGPPKASTLTAYASQLPENFRWVAKVWEEITIPVYARHPRYGSKAGERNPAFLNAEIFRERFLPPFMTAQVKPHVGPFVFQFQELWGEFKKEPQLFFAKLEEFLSLLPKEFNYAVEIRNSSFLVADYFELLNRQEVTHCFNHWTDMPPLREQMKRAAEAGGLIAPFYLSRVLTPLGVKYEEAKARFAPYDRIQNEMLSMRQDLVRLAMRAVERKVPAFVLVNNRSEGCAPLTIKAVSGMVAEELKRREQQ